MSAPILTPQPPTRTPAQERAIRQIRKARSTQPQNPKLDPAYLADERMYIQLKRYNGED